MSEEFEIATDVKSDNPLELDLHNLKVRLKIQMDMVARTRADIEHLEELLEKQQQKNKTFK